MIKYFYYKIKITICVHRCMLDCCVYHCIVSSRKYFVQLCTNNAEK